MGGEPVPKRKKRPATANQLMLDEIQRNLNEVSGFTAEQWSKRIHKSRSTIVETETWKELAGTRERQRAEKALDRSHTKTGRKRTSN